MQVARARPRAGRLAPRAAEEPRRPRRPDARPPRARDRARRGLLRAVALSSDDDAILAEADGLDVVAPRAARPSSPPTPPATTTSSLHALADAGRAGVAVRRASRSFSARRRSPRRRTSPARSTCSSAPARSRSSPSRGVDAAHHPLKLKRLEGDRLLPFLEDDRLTPSHELPPLWVRNGSVYVVPARRRRAWARTADDVRGYEMPPERSFDIDTPRDLAFAEFLVRSGERL